MRKIILAVLITSNSFLYVCSNDSEKVASQETVKQESFLSRLHKFFFDSSKKDSGICKEYNLEELSLEEASQRLYFLTAMLNFPKADTQMDRATVVAHTIINTLPESIRRSVLDKIKRKSQGDVSTLEREFRQEMVSCKSCLEVHIQNLRNKNK